MKTFWIILSSIIGVPIVLGIILLVYAGAVGPDTKIVPASKIKSWHENKIQKLKILDDNEKIEYFYSDGFISIETGMYMVTNKNLIIYSEYMDPYKNKIPFNAIKDIELIREEGLWTDSAATVYLYNGIEFYFPLSSELGGDQRFIQRLQEKTNLLPLPTIPTEKTKEISEGEFESLFKNPQE